MRVLEFFGGLLGLNKLSIESIPDPPVITMFVARLTPDVLEDLRKRIGGSANCIATSQTTDIQAGYMLGINHVLNVLQEGFTLPSQISNK